MNAYLAVWRLFHFRAKLLAEGRIHHLLSFFWGGGGMCGHAPGVLTPDCVGMCVKNGHGLRNELPVEDENAGLRNELDPF